MRTEGFYETDDGLSVWYGLTGCETGTGLILCDGIGCDGFIWPHIMDRFSPQAPILRWHYRGHGRTRAEQSDDLSVERLARDLEGLHNHIELGPAVVVGHSMGVQVALEYYRRAPELVGALVLLCGSHGRPLSTFQGSSLGETLLPYIRAAVDRTPRLSAELWARLIPTALSYRVAQATEINAKRVRRADFFPYLEHASRMELPVFLAMLALAAGHDAQDVLETIHVPTLIVAGDLDGFTPVELSADMAERIPGAELFRLAEGTHTAPIEYPDELNERLARFFEEHGL